ncbi:MAG: GIY-YIG nuclease family protein [Acidobacteriota bacterium]
MRRGGCSEDALVQQPAIALLGQLGWEQVEGLLDRSIAADSYAIKGPTDPYETDHLLMWHLYMVRAKDRSLYTGIATNVDRRMAEHLGTRNKGARYLRGRGPFRLAFHRPIGSRALALKVEHRIKRMSKTKKEELVRSNPDTRRLLEMLAIRLHVGK